MRLANRLLEDWAAWRIEYEFYTGTGSSPLVRFLEPGKGGIPCCRPLWTGVIRSELAQLNGLLVDAMTDRQLHLLLMVYGMTTGSFRQALKTMDDNCSERTIRRIKERARLLAEQVIGSKRQRAERHPSYAPR